MLRVDPQPKTLPTNPYAVLGLEDGAEEIRYQSVEGDGPLKMGRVRRAWDDLQPGIVNI